jgi:hypothetical protein
MDGIDSPQQSSGLRAMCSEWPADGVPLESRDIMRNE